MHPSLFLLCFLVSEAFSKEPRHRSLFYRFYEDKVIPEDAEVDVILYKGYTQRLYFLLEGSHRPISVTVTPCSTSSVLEWKISHGQNVAIGPTGGRPPSASYVGNERRSYTNPRAPPGLYTLELRSSSDSSCRVLLTTRAITHMPYHPPLPPEPGVQILKIKRNRILISWKASLSMRPLEYCVTSNNRGNYNSLCSADADLHVPAHSHAARANMSCVGRKTWHLFKGLQKGRTYYFDVFVLDSETNASSAYVGVSATLRGSATSSRVRDDTLATFTLDESNGYTVNTKYQLGRAAGSVLLFVQSCTGPGPVNLHITRLGSQKQEILSTTVMDVKTLEIPRQTSAHGNATSVGLTVRSTTMHSRRVRLWISGKRHAFPFPVLPQDKSVRVFETLSTCDSITIGWKTSPDERVKYCIYRQAAHHDLMELAEPQNFCEPRSEGSPFRRTVLCRRYHRFSKRRFNNLIMQKVMGLRPGATYLFEVQVTKVKGKMLPYEHVWATTRDSCYSSRSVR